MQTQPLDCIFSSGLCLPFIPQNHCTHSDLAPLPNKITQMRVLSLRAAGFGAKLQLSTGNTKHVPGSCW